MPGVVPPLGPDGCVPSVQADIYRKLQGAGLLAQGKALQTSQNVLDAYQNTKVVLGQLNQVVTIGAGWIGGIAVGGVLVGTNLTGQGIAVPSGFAHTTITTTAGSTTATVAPATGFTNGYVIGAVDDAGNAAITPGTTYTITGTTVTLSQPALLTVAGGYCCTCLWTALGGTVNP